MPKIDFDTTQQKIILAIGVMERLIFDESLDVQINLIKNVCNNTIKGSSSQSRRDDLLSAVKRLQQISDNLITAAEYLNEATAEIGRSKPEPSSFSSPGKISLSSDIPKSELI